MLDASFIQQLSNIVTASSFPYLFFVQCTYYTSIKKHHLSLLSTFFIDLILSLFGSTVTPIVLFGDIPGISLLLCA